MLVTRCNTGKSVKNNINTRKIRYSIISRQIEIMCKQEFLQ